MHKIISQRMQREKAFAVVSEIRVGAGTRTRITLDTVVIQYRLGDDRDCSSGGGNIPRNIAKLSYQYDPGYHHAITHAASSNINYDECYYYGLRIDNFNRER